MVMLKQMKVLIVNATMIFHMMMIAILMVMTPITLLIQMTMTTIFSMTV